LSPREFIRPSRQSSPDEAQFKKETFKKFARTAALVDPEGDSLARCLAEIEGQEVFRAAAE
jgi:hypothetical protein